MHNFYFIPDDFRVAVTVLGTLGVTALAMAFILAVHCLHKDLARICKTALIFLALCQTVLCCALIAQVQMNAGHGYIVESGYTVSRYILAGIILLLSAGLSVWNIYREEIPFIPPLAAAVTAALTLPLAEALSGAMFPYIYTAALAIWLMFGVRLSFMYAKELRSSISNLSVKQAMDSLNTAVMFYRKSGHILLLNHAMQELMVKTSGKVFRNGKKYMDTVIPRAAACETDGGYIYRLPDGAAWLFTATEAKRNVMQLTATDITEQERANTLLKETRARLEERNKHLRGVIENIEEIRHIEELIRMKSHVHDIMGQKLTVLLRSLRQGKWPADDILASVSVDLLGDLRQAGEAVLIPEVELNALIGFFEQTGGRIEVTGELPQDKDTALALVQILREAAVNAVKHGYAHEVYAEITQNGNIIRMQITDSGANPPERITEGAGIAGIRRRLARIGGVLEIELQPRFTLTVTV